MNSPGRFIPSIILGEVYPEPLRGDHALDKALSDIAAEGYFRRVELPLVESDSFAALVRSTRRKGDLAVTLWTSEILARENLNLGCCDETRRRASVARLRSLMERASECEADCVGVLSGPDPGQPRRDEGSRQLVRSLVELGRIAEDLKGVNLAIEPLDRGAHKNGLLGPTDEAVKVIERVRQSTGRVFIGWDSGHALLNEEDPVASLQMAAPWVYQMHLSNPVTDRSSPLHGDHHYPVGPVGDGTEIQFRGILEAAARLPLALSPMSVAVEVRTQNQATPGETVAHCRAVLKQIWPKGSVYP
ncbi:MAG: sugar phosphate isomerase/epimerase family protein [Opitutaceae bacterium]